MTELQKVLLYGLTHTGKTYSYLSFIKDPSMKGKKMLIIATDTIANITDNIEDGFPKYKDRFILLIDDKTKVPYQITKDVSTAERAMVKAMTMIKDTTSNIGCVVVDNYDNLEELYIEQHKKDLGSDKIRGYEYGIPRGKVYFKYIKPFLVHSTQHFFLTSDMKDKYLADKPVGKIPVLPANRLKHFNQIVGFETRFAGTPKEKVVTSVKKAKGFRHPVDLGDTNEYDQIIIELKQKLKDKKNE